MDNTNNSRNKAAADNDLEMGTLNNEDSGTLEGYDSDGRGDSDSWLGYLPSFLKTSTETFELPMFATPDGENDTDNIKDNETSSNHNDNDIFLQTGPSEDNGFVSRIARSIVTLPQREYTHSNPASDNSSMPHGGEEEEDGITSCSDNDDGDNPSVWTTTTKDLVSVQSRNQIKFTKCRTDFNGLKMPVTAGKVAPFAKSNEGFFADRRSSLQSTMRGRDVTHVQLTDEVGFLGGAWRGVLIRLMLSSYDSINGLQLSRILQLQLPFFTGYESYLTSQVIEALDNGDKRDLARVLKIALHNRNVSRVIVQNLSLRYDFVWHWSTQLAWNRQFDAWGQFPIVGITAFPATENFPSTRNHALASIFRVALGEGNWITRIVTSGREGLITDNPKNTAQNLAAESNGFELANRNQYGTYFGRQKTNDFRFAHRLPTDESLVRTFVVNPIPTMTNNGVVHVLRQLSLHWHRMLGEKWGNFAHQRMEQLDPFDTLRFHIPQVCVTLSSLRGQNIWDSQVLGPVMKQLQSLRANVKTTAAKKLVVVLKEDVVLPVCGGVASIVDPFQSWLDAILLSLNRIEREAPFVYDIVQNVELGIRLGHDLVTQVNWKVPSDQTLRNAILRHIREGAADDHMLRCKIQGALQKTTPRDMRTLIEMVRGGYHDSKPARLLLGRVKTLLQRELRREYLNQAVRDLSMGPRITGDLKRDEWYWVEEGARRSPHIYIGRVPNTDSHRFVHVESGNDRIVTMGENMTTIRSYVPIAEAISRAQKAFMTIELEHGKVFSYSAFMELSFLRVALRRLVVVAELNCEELDNARLNVLREVQRARVDYLKAPDLIPGRTYYRVNERSNQYTPFTFRSGMVVGEEKIVRCPPQSMLVVGGGPTGLMTTIHCAESCLITGGDMRLQEARDAFVKGGSTFERAQVVRLDARWISMLRYHLGTVFEDVYIPASGETDSQLGNTLPTQGFVEITIKDLESSLHTEVSRLWSRGIISVYTDAKAQFDPMTNSMTKLGKNLKDGDIVLRKVDYAGKKSNTLFSWKVTNLIYTRALNAEDLEVGKGYGVWIRSEEEVLPFQLVDVDSEGMVYSFRSFTPTVEDFTVNVQNLPSVYPAGTDAKAHAYVDQVELQSIAKATKGGKPAVEILAMDNIRDTKYTMDIGRTHVVEAIGKRPSSDVHLSMTTSEPYGVCCMQGLKVSMGMHNFGEKRWGSGIVDDIRSRNDQNTRIVGDFTKMVRVQPIVQRMYDLIDKDEDWRMNFEDLAKQLNLNDLEPVVPKLVKGCYELLELSPSFHRQTLQTRFFETGDNYYLGMEFTREYDMWKKSLCEEIVRPLYLATIEASKHKQVDALKATFGHHIDRLWYDGCLETIRTGDVYNPGARHRVPRLYLINSYKEMKLGSLPVGESFRLVNNDTEKYEILLKTGRQVVARNIEGYIFRMKRSSKVRREGNLTRGPDGNRESKVALATFDVGHYVNHRTVRLSDTKGYVSAFIGDEQATPHFMRYSGLTGACINAMSFNIFVSEAIRGVSFKERLRAYSEETNWSNGEVVQRGTGGNYGEDGFLRPGFSYRDGVSYLYSKMIEYKETKASGSDLLSHDWKVKMAAALIPRGMERNNTFLLGLRRSWNMAVMDTLLLEVESDPNFSVSVVNALKKGAEKVGDMDIDSQRYWNDVLQKSPLDSATTKLLSKSHFAYAQCLSATLGRIIDFAWKAQLKNERVSSQLSNQPKPVDSLVDNFSVEAQNFANSLTQSSAFAAGALAFRLAGTEVGNTASALLAGLNIAISFGTMTNVARYKIRNEEARVVFREQSLPKLQRVIFGLMDAQAREETPIESNPFFSVLEEKVETFRETAVYYGYLDELAGFNIVYQAVQRNINVLGEIEQFQKYIAFKLMADTFHVNSYVQETLVDIYRVLDELSVLLKTECEPCRQTTLASKLFKRLEDFEPALEDSLQRGSVRFGFIKRRRFLHWDFATTIRFLYSLFCCSFAGRSTPLATIHTETQGIAKATKELSKECDMALDREERDLETLYWATRESDVASMIFLSGFFVFAASIIFTLARIFNIGLLEDVAFWANLISETGAILALYHLWRKFIILLKLWWVLRKKTADTDGIDRQDMRRVRSVTFTQIMLTVTRLAAAGGAGVALPWFVIERAYPTFIPMDSVVPNYIAFGSVMAAIGATLFFFLVEYVVRFNLNPKLGQFVCELFRPEIEEIYLEKALRKEDLLRSPEIQKREAWEYTARIFLHEYRFDTVFAADRFGSILQYIQSGMQVRNDFI